MVLLNQYEDTRSWGEPNEPIPTNNGGIIQSDVIAIFGLLTPTSVYKGISAEDSFRNIILPSSCHQQ